MIDPVTTLSMVAKPGSLDVSKPSPGISVQDQGASDVRSFADALSSMGTSTISQLNKAEALSLDALRGNAAPREVAEAVMSAEQSLQMAIAVRDKIVTAYLEISRMAI